MLIVCVATFVVTFLALVLVRSCGPRPTQPEIIGKVDTVPDTVIVRSRPRIVVKWRDRIVTKTVPVRVAVSEGTPDTMYALRYALQALAADSARRARIEGHTPILPPASGTYDGKRLTLWLTRSDGSLMKATANLKPKFSFFAGYDKGSDTLPIFQTDRWFIRLGKQTVKCAPPAAVMAGVGALVHNEDAWLGAAIMGGATLVGCLIG